MSEHPPGGKKKKSSRTREVAKLVPVDAPKTKPFVGSMKGSVLKYERPFDPIDGEYDINR